MHATNQIDLLLLTENGANVNIKDKKGKTPLHSACEFDRLPQENCLEVIKFLIANAGADLNSKDNDGRTPLYFPCENGHWNVVKLLVGQGTNINEKTTQGLTPLYAAAANNRMMVVWFFVRQFPWLVSERLE